MENEKKIEQLIILGLETAKKLIESHKTVIPFGVRVFNDNEEVSLCNYYEAVPDADWNELIEHTITKLKEFAQKEDICATGIFTTLENGDDTAVGIQIETPQTAKLFIFPYTISEDAKVTIKEAEPIQSEALIASNVFTIG